jgi:FkbM family methyltransferase
MLVPLWEQTSMTKFFQKLAMQANSFYKSVYSYHQVGKTGLIPPNILSPLERYYFLELMPVLVGSNLVVYDIGAAEGFVSSCLAKLPNVSDVHAFEPLPDFFKKLKAKTQAYQKVTCHNLALSNDEGTFPMFVNTWATTSSLLPTAELLREQIPDIGFQRCVDIQAICLDKYVAEKKLPTPDVIKMDVQGFEKKVIEGGVNTVRSSQYCFIEMSFQQLYEEAPLFDEIYQLMRDLGFSIIGVSNPLRSPSGTPLQVDGIFHNLKIN